MAELDELEQAEVTEDRFIVDTPEKADWALYKLRETNETINQNKKLADKNHERIDEWLERENSKANESKEYFEGLLQEYFTNERTKNLSSNSVALMENYLQESNNLNGFTKKVN